MIMALLLAANVAAASPPVKNPAVLSDAAHAIDAGRLEQARLMIGRAVAAGFSGFPVDRLIADLAFASGDYEQALREYQGIVASGRRVEKICENGALAALFLGRTADARPLADCATESGAVTWRAWNAQGVLADMRQDWDAADRFYEKADQFAPRRAEVINNRGWSHLLRGDWLAARSYFEEAAKLGSASPRIANNLELARTALDADLPGRRAGESQQDWAQRLNDAGVAAQLLGDKKRALAAFTQALYASDPWYSRAAANLQAASAQ
jgi:Flp pilus assembly protein TadD